MSKFEDQQTPTGSPSGSPTSPEAPEFQDQVIKGEDGSETTISWKRVTETKSRPDGSKLRVVKRVKTVKVVRPTNMSDLRKSWAHFGKGLENEPGLYVQEAAVPIELGGTDPDERKARDEVIKLMNLSLEAPVKVPMIRKSALATAAAQAAAAPAAAATSSGEPEVNERKTWASARTKKEQDQAKTVAGADEKKANNVIRISNLTDEISEVEIRRLFGPENDLGNIQRLYVAKDPQGNRRGFAYVTYGNDRDAARAIDKMHRKPFKHVILLVDYGTNRSGGGGGRR